MVFFVTFFGASCGVEANARNKKRAATSKSRGAALRALCWWLKRPLLAGPVPVQIPASPEIADFDLYRASPGQGPWPAREAENRG